MDLFFIFLAQYLLIVPVGVGGVYFLRQPYARKKKMVIFALIALPLMGLAAFIGNHLYQDPRPFVVEHFTPLIPHAADNGFPSDHTLLASAIAAIVFIFNRRLGMILLALALLIGSSRVYIGLHHPIDVFGSIVIAFGISFLVHVFLDRKSKVQKATEPI